MDSASVAAWIAAVISGMGAVIAVRQARHAKDAARSAESQAESAVRQARVAEEDLLLSQIRMEIGGDDARALAVHSEQVAARRFLHAADEYLEFFCKQRRMPERSRDTIEWMQVRRRSEITFEAFSRLLTTDALRAEINSISQELNVYVAYDSGYWGDMGSRVGASRLRERIERLLAIPAGIGR